jgi:hypothetical protein
MNDLGSEIAYAPLKRPVGAVAATTPQVIVLTTAELAECTCPEFCERDHDVD